MALIIEDGSGKTDSNSYASVSEATAYALARGITLPSGDSAVEALLTNALDYLEAQRGRYQGFKTFPDHPQALQWPRTGVQIDCNDFPKDAIPRELKAAQMQLVVEQANGQSLMPSSDGNVVKRKKVDVLEKEFFSAQELGNSGLPMPSFPKVDALLAPLFNACGDGFALTTVRI